LDIFEYIKERGYETVYIDNELKYDSVSTFMVLFKNKNFFTLMIDSQVSDIFDPEDFNLDQWIVKIQNKDNDLIAYDDLVTGFELINLDSILKKIKSNIREFRLNKILKKINK